MACSFVSVYSGPEFLEALLLFPIMQMFESFHIQKYMLCFADSDLINFFFYFGFYDFFKLEFLQSHAVVPQICILFLHVHKIVQVCFLVADFLFIYFFKKGWHQPLSLSDHGWIALFCKYALLVWSLPIKQYVCIKLWNLFTEFLTLNCDQCVIV